MPAQEQFVDHVAKLEYLLVRQFRLLQDLIEASQKEKDALLEKSDDLMQAVENKEVLLDQLGYVENDRRKAVQDILLALGIQAETDSIKDVVPHLDEEAATRMSRLAEGISSLVYQAREQNQYNQAIAHTRLDWLKAAQYLLVGVAQPEVDYRPPAYSPVSREAPERGFECRV
jgi:flagellar biosynthesis/type III secretory pathway chaperone